MNNLAKLRVLYNKFLSQISYENFRRFLRNPYLIFSFFRTFRAALKRENIDTVNQRAQVPQMLSKIFDVCEEDVEEYMEEFEDLEYFQHSFEDKWRDLEKAGALGGTAGKLDCQIMYVVCRIQEPDVVVETGVRYGAFDSHILAALDKNGSGKLYSIDLPDAVNEFDYGYLVSQKLMDRWEFRKGNSLNVLPELMKDLNNIDIFLHDSLHVPKHIRNEYNAVYPYLEDEAILASHDIYMTDTFQEFVKEKDMENVIINNIGIGIKDKVSDQK